MGTASAQHGHSKRTPSPHGEPVGDKKWACGAKPGMQHLEAEGGGDRAAPE